MQKVLSDLIREANAGSEGDFLHNILGKHHDDAIGGNIPVVLFGAGSLGERLCNGLRRNNVSIAAFCDNNSELAGRKLLDVPIISVEKLRRDHLESLIVISASQPYGHQIKDQLSSLGFSGERIHAPALDPLLYYSNAVKLHWTAADLEKHATELQDAYDLLCDKRSKDLFVKRIALLAGAIDYESFRRFILEFGEFISKVSLNYFSNPAFDENFFYFHSEFFPLKDQEVFANVGALVGDCAIEFANACKQKGYQYKGIINFEPDPVNFEKLSANMKLFPNVRCLPYGLWSSKDRLRFSNPKQSSIGTPGWLDKDGSIEVDVDSMDQLLAGEKITFIKMDVEGAEIEALKGAVKTIRGSAPKLAISVYHKRNDIFEIPLLIHEIYPGYKFYLRHHSTTFSETVLFAVP